MVVVVATTYSYCYYLSINSPCIIIMVPLSSILYSTHHNDNIRQHHDDNNVMFAQKDSCAMIFYKLFPPRETRASNLDNNFSPYIGSSIGWG